MNDAARQTVPVISDLRDLANLPSTLDGSTGANRASPTKDGKHIDANKDIDAIEAWLNAKCTNHHTRRAYHREAYRLLLWAVHFHHKPMSSLTYRDLVEFDQWLAHPEQHPDWPAKCGMISGPLVESSRLQALTILRGMFNWLAAADYLAGSPFVQMRSGSVQKSLYPNAKVPSTRIFEGDLWVWMTIFLDRLPHIEWPRDESGKVLRLPDVSRRDGAYMYWRPQKWTLARYERLRFIVHFLYRSCARRSELAMGKMGQIVQINDVWYWNVRETGCTRASVVLDDETMATLRRYRVHRRLVPNPQRGEDAIPIVSKLSHNSSMTDWMLYRELKTFFKHCEMYLRHVEPDHAEWLEKLKQGSTHWLRHSWASHAASAGVDILATADKMRHATTATTEAAYVQQIDEDHRQFEIGKLREKLK